MLKSEKKNSGRSEDALYEGLLSENASSQGIYVDSVILFALIEWGQMSCLSQTDLMDKALSHMQFMTLHNIACPGSGTDFFLTGRLNFSLPYLSVFEMDQCLATLQGCRKSKRH